MPTLANGSGALRINVPKGSSLIIRNQSGVETVTGSSVAREDASAVLGSGVFVYGPQTASSDVTISTNGACDYDIVAGDPTPARDTARVVRNAATGSPSSLVDPATGQAVGGGGGTGDKTAQRRARAAQWNGPAWIQARTLAQEIALGTTTVQVGRRFRHTVTGQLYECTQAGTIGTAEPSTWVPNIYLTASPYMTPVGGTAQFISLGVASRAPRSDRPAPTVTNVGVNNIGNNALFTPDANTTTWSLTAGMSTGVQSALPISSRTAAQQKFWLPGTNRFDFSGGGGPIRLINIFDPVAGGSNWTGKGLTVNFTAYSPQVGLAFSNADGGPEIFINGSPLTEDPFGLLDSAGNWGHIVIAFPDGYPVNDFRIVSSDNLTSVFTQGRGYIMPVVEPEYRLMMLADSIGNTTTNSGKARYPDSVIGRIATSLGANTVACMQFGGTGYVQRNGGNNNAQDYLLANPAPFPNGTADCIVFMHGNNDAGNLANGNTTKDQIKRIWDLAVSQHPNAIIQICGLWGAPYASTDAGVVAETRLFEAWNEWGNPNSDWIGGMLNDSGVYDPHVRPAKQPFVSYNASQNFGLDASSGIHYQGNSHAFIGRVSNNDNIHPTMFGNMERARRISLSADANLARRGY